MSESDSLEHQPRAREVMLSPNVELAWHSIHRRDESGVLVRDWYVTLRTPGDVEPFVALATGLTSLGSALPPDEGQRMVGRLLGLVLGCLGTVVTIPGVGTFTPRMADRELQTAASDLAAAKQGEIRRRRKDQDRA